MNKDYGQNDPQIADYVENLFQPEDDILKEIRVRSVKSGLPEIQVCSLDARHLEVLAKAIGAKVAVEIGTLGGYSGTCLLRGMGEGGKLFSFEINEVNASVARESFKKAGFEKSAEIILGPALLNLPRIKKHGPFDLVFIDADKLGYPDYLNWAIENLRIGGVILADNTFAMGRIADENEAKEPTVKALRAFNEVCAKSERLKSTILPTGEGLTFAVKIK
jgi:caffeoyl-CoA O-methyltransferase